MYDHEPFTKTFTYLFVPRSLPLVLISGYCVLDIFVGPSSPRASPRLQKIRNHGRDTSHFCVSTLRLSESPIPPFSSLTRDSLVLDW